MISATRDTLFIFFFGVCLFGVLSAFSKTFTMPETGWKNPLLHVWAFKRKCLSIKERERRIVFMYGGFICLNGWILNQYANMRCFYCHRNAFTPSSSNKYHEFIVMLFQCQVPSRDDDARAVWRFWWGFNGFWQAFQSIKMKFRLAYRNPYQYLYKSN